MRVCLVSEGAYPYVSGGVSEWMQMLITGLSEVEFVVYCICATEEEFGQYKYEIPKNVVEMREVCLESAMRSPASGNSAGIDDISALRGLVGLDVLDWNRFFHFISSLKEGTTAADVLSDRRFFEIIVEMCGVEYENIPFTDFFWTTRSMLIPLLYLLIEGMPVADIYHSASTGYAGIMSSYGAWVNGKPFILAEHGIYTREREEEILKANWVIKHFKQIWIEHFYALADCSYTNATLVTSLFESNREIQREFGCASSKQVITPNGVDYERYSSIKPDGHTGVFNIGAVVRVVAIKDIKTMLFSFAMFSSEVPNTHLYIMGSTDEDPEYYEECQKIVTLMHISNVTFTGRVKIDEWLPKMDLLILTSISEGQPLVILEGLAAGIPYITSNVGCCRELLEIRSKSGIVVPVMNYSDMKEAILFMYNNPEQRRLMGENGREMVNKHYRLEMMLAQHREIYTRQYNKSS